MPGSGLQPALQMLGGLLRALGAVQESGQVFQRVGMQGLVLQGLSMLAGMLSGFVGAVLGAVLLIWAYKTYIAK